MSQPVDPDDNPVTATPDGVSRTGQDPRPRATDPESDTVANGADAGTAADQQNAAAPRRAAPTRRRGPSIVTSIGILLICLGLAGFGWIGYQYYGTNAPANEAAAAEASQLRDQWKRQEPASTAPSATASGAATPSSGTSSVPTDQPTKISLDSAMAIIRIPRFGSTYEKPVLVGTSDYSLGRGVAWYETTARPGQIGNFALAGHRVTHGEPFARLLELQVGDQVTIETRDYLYTYVIDTPPSKLTVKDVDTWVIDPVPGKPDVKPTQALITLTTCQDLFHSPDRAVGFGHLVTAAKK